MRKIVSVCLILCLAVLFLSACSGGGGGNTKRINLTDDDVPENGTAPSEPPLSTQSVLGDPLVVQDSSQIKIGFSVNCDQSVLADSAAKGFAEYATQASLDYKIFDAKGSVEQQQTDIEELIAQGCDAIAVYTEDEQIVPTLNKTAKHVPLVTIGRLAGAETQAVVGADDYTMAYRTAATLLEIFTDQNKMAILRPSTSSWSIDRRMKALDYVLEYTQTPLLSTVEADDVEQAYHAALQLLEQEQLGALWCLNAATLEGAGRAAKELDSSVAVGGIGYSSKIFELVEEGYIKRTATPLPWEEGRTACEVAAGLVLGEYYPEQVEGVYHIYTTENIESAKEGMPITSRIP